MAPSLRPGKSRWRGLGQLSPWLLLVASLLLVRFSKGAGFADAYALITRPFWPGSAQREWIVSARTVEDQARLQLLEQDNLRLRELLELQRSGSRQDDVGVPVISRSHGLLVGRGSSRLILRFIDKDPNVSPGDLVTTSPASTLLPPNVSVGVIQSVDERAVPAPTAIVQLIAASEAIDWVQVRTR